MLNTPHMQELIKKGDVIGVKEALRAQQREAACRASTSRCYKLYKRGQASTLEEALSNADSRTNLEAKINFG